MWQSERQRCVVVLRLLGAAGLYHPDPRLDRGLWTEGGPTETTLDYVARGSPLSHGEHIVLEVAMDVWNGGGGAQVADLLATLDEKALRAVAVALLQRDGGVVPFLDEALASVTGEPRP